MSAFRYFSPLWIGTLLAAALYINSYPQIQLQPRWIQMLLACGCVLAGVWAQVELVGVQGAFAQVLPATRGRSIRGSGAVVTGWLILAANTSIIVSLYFAMVDRRGEAIASGIVALLLAAAVVLSYFWSLPTAVDDFGRDSARAL